MPSELYDRIARTFEDLLDRIEAHATYGPKLRAAVERADPLVLDYHTHAPGEPYCVSVATLGFALEALGHERPVIELAHVRGVGERAEQCEVLMSILAERMMARYELAAAPEIRLDGAPLAPPDPTAEG